MSSSKQVQIYTRQADVAALLEYDEIRLGGIMLYGPVGTLVSAVRDLESMVESIVLQVPSIGKSSIGAALLERVVGLDRRVASAVVGSVLHQGRLVAMPGEDEDGTLITIICAPARRGEFDTRVMQVERDLRANNRRLIKELRTRFFRDQEGQAWTWAWHIACRASYLGKICFIDRYRLAWTGVEHVVDTAE